MYRIVRWKLLILMMTISSCAFAQQFAMVDPTCPLNVQCLGGDADISAVRVDSVLISPNRKLLFVGNKVLGVGDEIMGKKIVDISRNGITLEAKDGNVEIPIAIKNPKITK